MAHQITNMGGRVVGGEGKKTLRKSKVPESLG